MTTLNSLYTTAEIDFALLAVAFANKHGMASARAVSEVSDIVKGLFVNSTEAQRVVSSRLGHLASFDYLTGSEEEGVLRVIISQEGVDLLTTLAELRKSVLDCTGIVLI